MSQYFPKPYEPFGGDINVKVDLSNYATKTDIKNISHIDTSNFALKSNLASLQTEIDKIDIDKLVPVYVDLSKLSDAEKKLTDHAYDKHITTPEFNKVSAEIFYARLARANLVRKTDFDNKLKSQNQKINSNKTKHLLVENEFKKLKTFDSVCFRGENHFKDCTQNYLVFQPMYPYFTRFIGVGSGNYIFLEI